MAEFSFSNLHARNIFITFACDRKNAPLSIIEYIIHVSKKYKEFGTKGSS